MMSKARWMVVIAVAVLSLVACLHPGEPRRARRGSEFPLLGMVYDADNQPVPGAWIIVDDRRRLRTDINGRFMIPRLPPGRHRVEVQKEDFEAMSTVIDFIDIKQVLYLKVISRVQLLRKAERALQERRIREAEEALRRAEAIRSNDPIGMYLRAILLAEAERFAEAAAVLQGLLTAGYREAPVYLALADIYQYRLRNPARAASYLEEALRRQRDPGLQMRLEELRRTGAGDGAPPGEPSAPQSPGL